MIALNKSVRLVVLQFSFSNPNVIPDSVKRLSRETEEERLERKSHTSGIIVIEPTEMCSIVDFVEEELEVVGYELVDAFCKERIDKKNHGGKKSYYMARFLFAYYEFASISREFREVRDAIRTDLHGLSRGAFWRVRSFSNPFYEDGQEVPGQRVVSINFEARQPIVRPDGEPRRIWQGDRDGGQVVQAPPPVKAYRCLRIVNHVDLSVV